MGLILLLVEMSENSAAIWTCVILIVGLILGVNGFFDRNK